MPKRNAIIAVASIRHFDINHSDNVEKITDYIIMAKKAKVDIICFPESCITRKSWIFINDESIKDIQKACKENSIWCIVSDSIKSDRKIYNIAILINRKGKIKGTYRKIHPYKEPNVTPGTDAKVFKTDFAKIGIVICWDLAFPELFSEMRQKGAEIVFCPSQWNYDFGTHKFEPIEKEKALLKAMILSRAHENVLFTALCNPLLKSKTLVPYSAIAEPHRIIAESFDKEGLITAKIDLSKIRKYRRLYSK